MSPRVEVHKKLAHYYRQNDDATKRDFHLGKMALLEGQNLYRNNKISAAIPYLQQATKYNDQDAQAWFYLAESQRCLLETEQAIMAYQKCLIIAPNHGRALKQLRFINQKS